MPEENRNRKPWFSRLCNGALTWIACAVCGGILLLNVLYRVWIDQSIAEQVQILPSLWRSVGMLVLTAVLILAAGRLRGRRKPGEAVSYTHLTLPTKA